MQQGEPLMREGQRHRCKHVHINEHKSGSVLVLKFFGYDSLNLPQQLYLNSSEGKAESTWMTKKNLHRHTSTIDFPHFTKIPLGPANGLSLLHSVTVAGTRKNNRNIKRAGCSSQEKVRVVPLIQHNIHRGCLEN